MHPKTLAREGWYYGHDFTDGTRFGNERTGGEGRSFFFFLLSLLLWWMLCSWLSVFNYRVFWTVFFLICLFVRPKKKIGTFSLLLDYRICLKVICLLCTMVNHHLREYVCYFLEASNPRRSYSYCVDFWGSGESGSKSPRSKNVDHNSHPGGGQFASKFPPENEWIKNGKVTIFFIGDTEILVHRLKWFCKKFPSSQTFGNSGGVF